MIAPFLAGVRPELLAERLAQPQCVGPLTRWGSGLWLRAAL